MGNHLSDALGGNTDRVLLSGYVLSGGTLGDQMDLRDHLVAVARRDAVDVDAVEQLVDEGTFEYGMPAYNAAMRDDAMLPVLLAINLRSHHPTITDNQATALITDGNRDPIRRHLLRAWGYRTRRHDADRLGESHGLPNCRRMIGFLRRARRLSYSEIRALTHEQLDNELMADLAKATPEEAARNKARREGLKVMSQLKSMARLDAIAAEHGVMPAELAAMPPEAVHAWVIEKASPGKVPPTFQVTQKMLGEYRRHHGIVANAPVGGST